MVYVVVTAFVVMVILSAYVVIVGFYSSGGYGEQDGVEGAVCVVYCSICSVNGGSCCGCLTSCWFHYVCC